jgi:hypothetical protein
MSRQCKLIEGVSEQILNEGPWPAIGEMWYVQPGKVAEGRLSDDHKSHRAGQPTLWVRIPGGPFCLDMRTEAGAQWSRVGEPPRITVTPSINEVDIWHGYIRDGMVTDDVEGRPYP